MGILILLLILFPPGRFCRPGDGSLNPPSPTVTEMRKKASEKPEPPPRPWSLRLSAGFTLNGGNTQAGILNGGHQFSLRMKRWTYKSSGEFFYGRSQGDTISNKGKWENALSSSLSQAFNLYSEASLDYDHFSGTDLRTLFGLGAQWVFSDTTRNKTNLASSINGELVSNRGDVPNTRAIRFHFTFQTDRQFSSTLKTGLKSILSTRFRAPFREYRLENQAYLSVMMRQPLWLSIKALSRYEHQPVADTIKKHDFSLITALEMSL